MRFCFVVLILSVNSFAVSPDHWQLSAVGNHILRSVISADSLPGRVGISCRTYSADKIKCHKEVQMLDSAFSFADPLWVVWRYFDQTTSRPRFSGAIGIINALLWHLAGAKASICITRRPIVFIYILNYADMLGFVQHRIDNDYPKPTYNFDVGVEFTHPVHIELLLRQYSLLNSHLHAKRSIGIAPPLLNATLHF